jgi:hypothetical protein
VNKSRVYSTPPSNPPLPRSAPIPHPRVRPINPEIVFERVSAISAVISLRHPSWMRSIRRRQNDPRCGHGASRSSRAIAIRGAPVGVPQCAPGRARRRRFVEGIRRLREADPMEAIGRKNSTEAGGCWPSRAGRRLDFVRTKYPDNDRRSGHRPRHSWNPRVSSDGSSSQSDANRSNCASFFESGLTLIDIPRSAEIFVRTPFPNAMLLQPSAFQVTRY